VVNNTPERFGAGLRRLAESAATRPRDEQVIFINAWNEWAEGNHLEPDHRFGLRFLREVSRLQFGARAADQSHGI